MIKLYSYASVWQGGGEIGLSHGHTAASSENEARGVAVAAGQKSFPGKVMSLVQVMEIEVS